MKIKLDENLPLSLVDQLQRLGHDVDSVLSESLAGFPDQEVWEAAQRAERFFITQDLDFSNIRQFAPGTHYGLLLVRLRAPGRMALVSRVSAIFKSEDVDGWSGSFVVATDHKLRVRRP